MRYQGIKIQSKYKESLKSRLAVCATVLAVLCVVRFTPDDTLVKVKKTVELVLTQQTDWITEFNKIKEIFSQEEGLASMNPVADFVNPAPDGEVCVGFGVQDAEDSDFHYGVDIKLSENQNISAAAAGEVTEIATSEEYGSYILIAHSDEIFTLYARLNEILPDVGEKVEAGKPIARANVDDNTFHFEIRRADTYLDPKEFIDFGEQNG